MAGNPNQISLGPGLLKVAPLLSAEPTDLATAWPAAWTDLGYTFEGSEFSNQLNTAPVEVAEELYPLVVVPTGIVTQVRFVLAQITAQNLARACNGGTITTGSGFVLFDPPAPGSPVRYMYGWQSDDGQERWIFRQCLNGGTSSMTRRKGADKAGIGFELNLEKPASVQPFRVIFADTRNA
jgi:hypothetical protein